MSIRLQFKKGTSFSADVILKDDALSDILQIITKYQTDEDAEQPELALSPPPLTTTQPLQPSPQVRIATAPTTADPSFAAKEFLLAHSPIEIMNRVGWKTNPNKVLLLGAYHEVHSGSSPWASSDLEPRFEEARDDFPANFSRDVGLAIQHGLIKTAGGSRSYLVTRTGWNKIGEEILKEKDKE